MFLYSRGLASPLLSSSSNAIESCKENGTTVLHREKAADRTESVFVVSAEKKCITGTHIVVTDERNQTTRFALAKRDVSRES